MSSKLININGGFYYVVDELAKPTDQAKPSTSAYASSGYQSYVPHPKLQKPANQPNSYPLSNEDPREKVAKAAKAAAERREAVANELANSPDNLLILEMTQPDPLATSKPVKEEEEDDTPSELTRYINFAANLTTSTMNQTTPKAVPTGDEEQEATAELTDYVAKCAHFGEVDFHSSYPHLNLPSKE